MKQLTITIIDRELDITKSWNNDIEWFKTLLEERGINAGQRLVDSFFENEFVILNLRKPKCFLDWFKPVACPKKFNHDSVRNWEYSKIANVFQDSSIVLIIEMNDGEQQHIRELTIYVYWSLVKYFNNTDNLWETLIQQGIKELDKY